MNWSKLSLILLGLAVLFVLLGGPFYGMSTNYVLGNNMWGMMRSMMGNGYGWMPMMGGFALAYYISGLLFAASFVSALLFAYRKPSEQSVMFIGAVSAVGFFALFVPGGQWLAVIAYVIVLFLLWK